MVSLLNSSIVDPSSKVVSVKSIGTALGLGFPLSVKDMLSRRDKTRVTKYGVCICTYTGGTPVTNWVDEWLYRAFSDPLGIASYFRKMSGGRKVIEWQVFPHNGDIMTFAEKQVLAAKGSDPEIESTLKKFLAKGIPVDSVDHVIFVIDEINSKDGVRSNDHIFLATNHIRPNNICHEMGHLFGLPHADKDKIDDYGDSYCLMGGLGPAGQNAVEFENSRLTLTAGMNSHGGSGPGICAPYLSKLGWIDSSINANRISLSSTVSGDLSGTLNPNQGGLPVGSAKRIALIIDVPATSIQYWVEYRIPQGFDRQLKGGPQGALLLRKVVKSHSYYLDLTPAILGGKLRLPELSYVIRITDVNSHAQEISYIFEKG